MEGVGQIVPSNFRRCAYLSNWIRLPEGWGPRKATGSRPIGGM